LFHDPAQGDNKILSSLVEDVERSLGVAMQPLPIPSSQEVTEAKYQRVIHQLLKKQHKTSSNNDEMIQTWKSRILQDLDLDPPQESSSAMSHLLTCAVMELAGIRHHERTAEYSLLTGSDSERTLVFQRRYHIEEQPLTPSEVTAACKAMGSGKLGRVTVCDDGANHQLAVFDLPLKRAQTLLKAASENEEFVIEIANHLPEGMKQ
jgi:hypothetical protein